MTGSLQEKFGMYYVVLRYKNEENKWKTKWINTNLQTKGNNKRKAETKKIQIIEEYTKKLSGFSKDMLFVDLVKIWFSALTIKDLDPITIEGYANTMFKHIIPYFEKKVLCVSEITPKTIENYYTHKKENGRCDGKGGLSLKSLKQHQAVFNQVFDYAVKPHNLISVNPAREVHLSKAPDYKAEFYSSDEIKFVLNNFKKKWFIPIILLTVCYGLRRSELVGLKWKAIDFSENHIRIEHTVVKNTSIIAKNKTKSKSSMRTYPMLPNIKQILLTIKQEQDFYANKFGKQYINHDGYVFTWPNGKLYRPDYITKTWSNGLKQLNIRHIRFHDLRHSCASLLIALGYSLKDIQEWLGHSDIKTTAMYSHLELSRKMLMGNKISTSLLEGNNQLDQSESGLVRNPLETEHKKIRPLSNSQKNNDKEHIFGRSDRT